jgi:diaminohydroxyphosphoribosylaminopyrimidine deaminase/5-amino-6-(5-phosphoribosylamino)uracil reductase
MAVAREVELAAMRHAIALSAAARGTTNPNPAVGAVVLDVADRVVGEGVTQAIGGDHAEVVALRGAGAAAAGGTIVVTLEPCRHTGRTQRCTDVIQAAGIRRVVFAMRDPHREAAGGGDLLRANGVEVEAGVLPREAASVLGPWTTAVARGRPHVTWKYAATLDGKTAALDGTSQWISGPDARRDAHRERLAADAVIVGIGTVLADDPQLTVRDWPARRQPLRVVVDSNARTPDTARILDPAARTLVVVAEDAAPDRVAALAAAGADITVAGRSDGGLDPHGVLAALAERDVLLAFLEGGATLATSFARADLVDRVVGYHAPMLLGAGRSFVGDLGITSLGAARCLVVDEVTRIGGDVRIVARISAGSE